jgi:hypothetical protein
MRAGHPQLTRLIFELGGIHEAHPPHPIVLS